MKKIISILLAVMLVVSVAAVSTGAVEYDPSDSYTVSNDTPTCEEAIKACNGGVLGDVQHIYFQLPIPVEGNEANTTWTNDYNSKDLGLDYCQVCIYWWDGIAGNASQGWPSGKGCTWVGYKTSLAYSDEEAGIYVYEAIVPADGGTPVVVWNNGVNAGMDKTKDIFKYGRQLDNANVEGAAEGDYDTLPEGSPKEDSMDGCIQIIDYSQGSENPLTGFYNYGSNWYVYYGEGCYGEYPTTSPNFHGRQASCCNPNHAHVIGDVNADTIVKVLDVLTLQYHLANKALPDNHSFAKGNADVDGDGYTTIIDASRVQRYLAKRCNIDGTTPYKDPSEYSLNPPTKK